MVQRMQKLFFQVNMQLRSEYSQIINQTFYSFSSTVQTFQWWMTAAHHVFKQCSATTDFGLPLYLHDASQLNPSHQPDGKSPADFSCSIFVRITCCYSSSPKSLLAKRQNMHFVFITQFICRKTLTNANNIAPTCSLRKMYV